MTFCQPSPHSLYVRWRFRQLELFIFVCLLLLSAQASEDRLDECECTVDSIKQFNAFRIYPKIQSITRKDYFRYFKVDLQRTCPFWPDDSKCALKDCSVEACHDEEVPFVRAEKLRLEMSESGSGEVHSEDLQESSSPAQASGEETQTESQPNYLEELPYYERAKTQSSEDQTLKPSATAPAIAEQLPSSTSNIMPTRTDEIQVTMATTVQPTIGEKIDNEPTQNDTSRSTRKQETTEGATQDEASCKEHNQTLGKIDGTISEESLQEFEKWRRHDDKIQDFCVFDDEHNSNASYFDLLLNPERFTGYAGPSARRVWQHIYEENCFKSRIGGTVLDLNQLCYEQRVFYRAISGLHSSINIHLCAEYYLPKMGKFLLPGDTMWGPNLEEFNRRFENAQTNGEGEKRLRNLYFVYLLQMRALHKAAAFLREAPFYTSRQDDTEDTRREVIGFLETIDKFESHFDEKKMFAGKSSETIALKEELRQHFRNISLIMDCVGCAKCRLWGKLQTQGLGAAFKILFSNDDTLELSRTEIVSLFNSFSRLSNSIVQLENFRKMSENSKKAKTASPFGRKEEL